MNNKNNFSAQQINQINRNTALINNIQISHGQDLIIQHPISQKLKRLLQNPFYTQKQQQIKNLLGMTLFNLKNFIELQQCTFLNIIQQFYQQKIIKKQKEMNQLYLQIKNTKNKALFKQIQKIKKEVQNFRNQLKSIQNHKNKVQQNLLQVVFKYQQQLKKFLNNKKGQNFQQSFPFSNDPKIVNLQNQFLQQFNAIIDKDYLKQKPFFYKNFKEIILQSKLKEKTLYQQEIVQQQKGKEQKIINQQEKKKELAQQQRQEPVLKQIRQYLNQLCHKVLSYGYKLLMENKLNSDQMKSFCSINILFNVKKLLQANINNSEVSVLICQKINEYIKCFMNTYIQKYHITWTKASKELHSVVQNFLYDNNSSWEDNDFLGLNKIKIEYKQDGDYFLQIMTVINKAIQVAHQVDQNSNMKNIESFYQFLKFVAVFSSDQINQISKKQENQSQKLCKVIQFLQTQNLQQIFSSYILEKFQENKQTKEKKRNKRKGMDKQLINGNSNFKQTENDKQKLQYPDSEYFLDSWYEIKFENSTKMKQKISKLQYNCKIDPTTHLFTQSQIQNREFSVRHSSILRLIVKWTQLLIQKFSPQKLINKNLKFKTNDFKKIEFVSKQQVFIYNNTKQINIWKPQVDTPQFLQNQLQSSKKKIKQLIKVIKYKHNFLQYLIGLQNIQNDFIQKKISNIGNFSSKISQLQSRHIISLLNSIIHILLNITQNKLPNQIINEQQILANSLKKINLVTFQIGDLIRGKYSCSQNQFVRFMKILQNVQSKKPQVIKLLKIKNRFQQITNDVLMQFIFKKKVKCEFQISLKGGANSENNKKIADFNHFLYQITRTLINPVSQMASIIKKVDPLISTSIFAYCIRKGIKFNSPKTTKLQYQFEKSPQFLYLPQMCKRCHLIKLIFEDQNKQRICRECWIISKRDQVQKQQNKEFQLFKIFLSIQKQNENFFDFIQQNNIKIQQKKNKKQLVKDGKNWGFFVNLKKYRRKIQFFFELQIFDQIKYYTFCNTITKQTYNKFKKLKEQTHNLQLKQEQQQRIILQIMEFSSQFFKQIKNFNFQTNNASIKDKKDNFIGWKLNFQDQLLQKIQPQLIKLFPQQKKQMIRSVLDKCFFTNLLKLSLQKKIIQQMIKKNKTVDNTISSTFITNLYETDKTSFEKIKILTLYKLQVKINQRIQWPFFLKNVETIQLSSKQNEYVVQDIKLPINSQKLKQLTLMIPANNFYISTQNGKLVPNLIKSIKFLQKIQLWWLNINDLKIQNMKNLQQLSLYWFTSQLNQINIKNCSLLKNLYFYDIRVKYIYLFQLQNLKQFFILNYSKDLQFVYIANKHNIGCKTLSQDKKQFQNKQQLKGKIIISNQNIEKMTIISDSTEIKKIFIHSCFQLRQLRISQYIQEMDICQTSSFECKSNKDSKLQKITIQNNQNLQNIEIYRDNKDNVQEEQLLLFLFQSLNSVGGKGVSFKFCPRKQIKVKQILFKNCPKIKSMTGKFKIKQIYPQQKNIIISDKYQEQSFNLDQKIKRIIVQNELNYQISIIIQKNFQQTDKDQYQQEKGQIIKS